MLPAPARAQSTPLAQWEQWQRLEGAVDVAGPRGDGTLVAAAAGRLFSVTPTGVVSQFASGPGGYVGSPDAEPYLEVIPAAPSLAVQAAGCAFTPDDVFILDFGGPAGLSRVDAAGRAARFADTPDVDWLFGIALDTTGGFDHRLLVSGTRDERTTVFAVDCRGGVSVVARDLPFVEGGFAVAPATFGAYAGMLLAPDELGGNLLAIAPDGTSRPLLSPEAPGLPFGPDTGIESLGFVPPGFIAGSGAAYVADRGTPDNPFPGTDSILRLKADALRAAGVQDGDLLATTEGGGITVAIRCTATCTAMRVAEGPPGGHIEGRITFAP